MGILKSLLIIGGGVVGITIAREAAKSKKFSNITLIEKEPSLGLHASTRNSGVIHAGFYYSPETKKALFCSEANKMMRNYCITNNLTVKKCGKIVVSKNKLETSILEELYDRGVKNKCNLEIFSKDKLIDYEPLAITVDKFLWSPNTWSSSPYELLECLSLELNELGVNIITGSKVVETNQTFVLDQSGEKYYFDIVINAAGSYSLSLAEMFGCKTDYAVLPFKGLYLKSNSKLSEFNSHIYPVPNINQPFLGIHTTLTYDGYLKLGPTALPAFSPENYSFLEGIDMKLLPEILLLELKLFLNNDFGFRNLALKEMLYLFKNNIIKSAQSLTSYKLKPELFDWYSPGIRPQLYNKVEKKLEMDFILLNNENQYHLINSISPAWTCSFRTASYVISEVIKNL